MWIVGSCRWLVGHKGFPSASPGKSLEVILTGERIDAQEAYRIGLVNEVVPSDQLLPEATNLAERFCRNAPLAVQAAKEAVYRGMGPSPF